MDVLKFLTLLILFTNVVITAIGEPISKAASESSNQMHLDKKCLMCKFSVSLINYALKTRKGYEEIDKISNNFCVVSNIESPYICASISKLFNREITKVISNGFITPNQVCGLLYNNTCGHFHSPLSDWEVNLNVSAHLDIKKLDEKKRAALDEKPYRVIHISDTHVDLKYKEGSPAVCEEPLCCQTSSTAKNSSQAQAGYWGSYGLCDVPLRTFESALRKLNSTIGESAGKIDYIVWTGDIQPHDVWSQNKKSAIKIYDTVFAKIFEYLPNVKILPTLGNHEMIPVDSFSPSNLLSIAREDSPVWLYKKLDSFWSRWLPNDTIATITKDGFYSTTVRKGLKVVSLNTNFCHTKNFWLYINSTDPGEQLQWLVHELQISELLHEKVHIIGHIPPGADDCLKVWSRNYNKILRRFADTVTGQFFGHTHNNEFEMFYDHGAEKSHKKQTMRISKMIKRSQDKAWKPISVGFIGPSVTTFVDLNPSFRIYDVDPRQGYVPTDFETYFMNLTLANRLGSVEPKWESAGLFSKRFGISDIKPQSMHNLLVDLAGKLDIPQPDRSDDGASSLNYANISKRDIETNPTAKTYDDRLFELYRLYNSYSDQFNRSVYDKISKADKSKFICRLLTGQAHDMSACSQFMPVKKLDTSARHLIG